MVTCKPGVQFTTIAPAGMRLLEAIRAAARSLNLPVVITSACDGTHAGPTDPHYSGEAYDLRTHDFDPSQKVALLTAIMAELEHSGVDRALPVAGGVATRHFYAFIESPGTDAEHLHAQRRNGTTYTMADYLSS